MRNAARWLFLVVLVYAPWAYGCTTSNTITILNVLLACVLFLYLIGALAGRRMPRVPFTLLAAGCLLLGIGWWMTINAGAVFDSEMNIFMPRETIARNAPASVDFAISSAWMVRATLLVLASWFVADLCQRAVWLMRIWYTLVFAGGSIALLGLLQKASGAQDIFWAPAVEGASSFTFFGPFYYHANAGAYLNLVLPLALGLAIRVTSRNTTPLRRALWLTCALCTVLAVFANTSRAAQFLGLVLLLIVGVRWLRHREGKISWRQLLLVCATGAVVIVTAVAVAQASRLDQPLERWQQFSSDLSGTTRWLATQAAAHALPDIGWFGFGPGTFRVVFPFYLEYLDPRASGEWRFLHEDYLQTLMEWGWAGAAVFALLFFGGIAVAIRCLRSSTADQWAPRRRVLLPLVVLALVATAAHATVDFPLQIASIQVYVATYLGICWGSSGWPAEVTSGPVARTLRSARA